MHLAPRDLDKLVLHGAGFLAQKRLARGLRLNYPEAVALLATQLLELLRDGKSVAELMDLGRRMLGRAEVMDGVPEMIDEVQVEGTFSDGTKLVTVHHRPSRSRTATSRSPCTAASCPRPSRTPRRSRRCVRARRSSPRGR
jgi:urease gamma subunit